MTTHGCAGRMEDGETFNLMFKKIGEMGRRVMKTLNQKFKKKQKCLINVIYNETDDVFLTGELLNMQTEGKNIYWNEAD